MTVQNQEVKCFRAGKLAALLGVSTDTLRHYERKGVLPTPERTPSGYRQYPAEAVARVRLIRRALTIGFTLDELAAVLRAKDQGRVPCQEVRTMAGEKLEVLEERLRALTELRDALKATLITWDEQLANTDLGQQAHLLEGLEVRADGTDPSSRGKAFPNESSRMRRNGNPGRHVNSRNNSC